MNDNNKKFESAVSEIKKVGMTETEKSLILRKILSSSSGEKNAGWPFGRSIRSPFVFRREKTVFYAAVLAVIIFISGSGIIYAAEQSLPGDLLYGVKVSVLEPMLSALARSPEQKARLAAETALKRLKEAETLAYQNRLDGSNAAKVQALLGAELANLKEATAETTAARSVNQTSSPEPLGLENLKTAIFAHTHLLQTITETAAGTMAAGDAANADSIINLVKTELDYSAGDSIALDGSPKSKIKIAPVPSSPAPLKENGEGRQLQKNNFNAEGGAPEKTASSSSETTTRTSDGATGAKNISSPSVQNGVENQPDNNGALRKNENPSVGRISGGGDNYGTTENSARALLNDAGNALNQAAVSSSTSPLHQAIINETKKILERANNLIIESQSSNKANDSKAADASLEKSKQMTDEAKIYLDAGLKLIKSAPSASRSNSSKNSFQILPDDK